MINQKLYIPKFVRITSVRDEANLVKTYRLKVNLEFKPGQFLQVSVSGVGEVPISISSSPLDGGFIELTVRSVGKVTGAIHNLNKGDFIGLRGPYGNNFPVENLKFKHFLFVGGGCGLAPLRSLMKYMTDKRKKYPRLTILYGARTIKDILFKDELHSLKKSRQADVNLSVDCGPTDESCSTGVVTSLLKKFNDLKGSVAFICGPEIMLNATIKELTDLDVKPEDIFLSLERNMQCGVGKCGHCYIKNKYVCTDGPIFSYRQLRDLGVGF